MRQLSILDPSERNRYVSDGVYIVRRAPKRFLGQLSSLIHRSNALGSSHGGKSQNVVVLFAASTHSLLSPVSSHTERKSAEPRPDLLNWRTEVTFGTILPTANMCPVQRERAAQTNLSCYTESPAGHRGPSGKAMIRRGTDHSFFHWGQPARLSIKEAESKRKLTRKLEELPFIRFAGAAQHIAGSQRAHTTCLTLRSEGPFHPIYTRSHSPSGPATTPQNGSSCGTFYSGVTAVERNKILRPPNIGDGVSGGNLWLYRTYRELEVAFYRCQVMDWFLQPFFYVLVFYMTDIRLDLLDITESTRRFIINMMIGMETRSTTGVLVVQDNQTINNSNLRRGKESKSMDINEPSLMDVAHDTINSTQGPALIEVAYFPREGRAFFVVIVGRSHEIYAGRRNQTKARRPKISLVLDNLANRIPAQRHSLFVRPLPFSLSLSTAGKAVVETKPIATPTIKYEIGPLLKDLMEWPTPPKSAYVIGELMAGNNPYGYCISRTGICKSGRENIHVFLFQEILSRNRALRGMLPILPRTLWISFPRSERYWTKTPNGAR
ncbi:unnamed protein product [Withania somnifera]